MAHNIMVMGEMWTFRRWALRKHYTLEQYTERQIALLLNEMASESSKEPIRKE